jgi:hypothetical protein
LSEGAIAILDELREDAKIGKNKHFNASDRKLKYHYYCGVPVVLINIFIGTVIVSLLLEDQPPSWAGELTMVLAFTAASLSALQTLFNFHKVAEGHRTIGNRYLDLSRKCKHYIRKQQDIELPTDELWQKAENLRKEYSEINAEAEAFPTNKKDLNMAKNAKEITPFINPFAKNEQS